MNLKSYLFAGIVMIYPFFTNAADWQKEIDELREDVLVLQRQMYRNSGSIATDTSNVQKTAQDTAKGDVQVKISEYDEIIRKVTGRMDTLEHELKQTNA